MDDERDVLRELQQLEESTDWGVDGDLLADNDEDDEGDDDGMAGVPSKLHLLPTLGAAEGLASPENIEDICSTMVDMTKNGQVKEVLVVMNLVDDEQVLFTTLERNDHIIGMMEVAKLNWHSSQIASQNLIGENE
jgi:hypothetical protein